MTWDGGDQTKYPVEATYRPLDLCGLPGGSRSGENPTNYIDAIRWVL
jgi:hypothetical protein